MSSDPTALVVLVPEADPRVAALRQKYDPSAADGMPAHITILYPFLDAAEINDGIIADLQAIADRHRRFAFSLSGTQTFPGVLYLAPEPAPPFYHLARAYAERFAADLRNDDTPGDYIPHLTVANTGDQRSITDITLEFWSAYPEGISIRSEVRKVSLMVRESDQWIQKTEFALAC